MNIAKEFANAIAYAISATGSRDVVSVKRKTDQFGTTYFVQFDEPLGGFWRPVYAVPAKKAKELNPSILESCESSSDP